MDIIIGLIGVGIAGFLIAGVYNLLYPSKGKALENLAVKDFEAFEASVVNAFAAAKSDVNTAVAKAKADVLSTVTKL